MTASHRTGSLRAASAAEQVLLEEGERAPKALAARCIRALAVTLARKDDEIDVLLSLGERCEQPRSVPEMDVLVDQSV